MIDGVFGPGIIIFYWGKPPVAQKLEKLQIFFGSSPYSGRSSSVKPSGSKTELKRCTTTEIAIIIIIIIIIIIPIVIYSWLLD